MPAYFMQCSGQIENAFLELLQDKKFKISNLSLQIQTKHTLSNRVRLKSKGTFYMISNVENFPNINTNKRKLLISARF